MSYARHARAVVTAAAIATLAETAASSRQDFSRWSTPCDGVERTAGIALGDVDSDGDLDVVFANGRHYADIDWIYTNNGAGALGGRRALGAEPDRSYGVALGDLDGDRDLDAIVANDAGNLSVVYQNDGRGHFTVRSYLGPLTAARRAVALGDFDRDGDLDAVLVGVGQDHVFTNEGQGRKWTPRPLGSRATAGARATGVAVADIDGDRDVDIIVPGRYQEPNVIFVNDGTGAFPDSRQFGAAADDPTSVAVGDLDGDGDADIVTGHWEQPHQVHRNDGQGGFSSDGRFGDGREQTWSVALGDLDLDGDLDVVAGNANLGFWSEDLDGDKLRDRSGHQRRNSPSRIYRNDGRAAFTAAEAIGTGPDNTRPVALGDLDGDGDLDVVMGNDCQQNHVFWNPVRSPAGKISGR